MGEYIRRAPPEAQEKLSQLRDVFRKVAPEAVEKISYNMPTTTKTALSEASRRTNIVDAFRGVP